MIRKPCPHGASLPKGLRCNHGYIETLIQFKGRLYCRVFGRHTRETEQLATIHLAEKRKDILLGRFNMAPPLASKLFIDVANLWFGIWKEEKDPTGKRLHAQSTIDESRRVLDKVFIPVFGKIMFEEIRPIDIERWREKGLKAGLSGTSLNRYQAVLGAIYGCITRWIEREKIPAFKVPVKNPSQAVEKAPNVKRSRILTHYEAKKLKLAFVSLQDMDGWEICKMALKSVLSLKDLKHLELGQEIDIERAKTGVPVNIPLPVLVKLRWTNWRKRWEAARKEAGLSDTQFRDLRKTGINWLKGKFDLKLVSEYAGHADIKTTEDSYTIKQAEYLEPLAKDLDAQVEAL